MRPQNPKAFLVTSKQPLSPTDIKPEDDPHVHRINQFSYLIDGVAGFYLVTELTSKVTPEIIAAPIWESVDGRFGSETQKWLQQRGIEARRAHR
jgi:hypothetical protein